MNDYKCSDCKYWVSSEGLDYGECRAQPPRFNDRLADILSDQDRCKDCHDRGFFPEVHKDDWCGLFLPERKS